MNEYTISAVQYDTHIINGIESYTLSPQLQRILLAGSGQVENTFTAVGTLTPTFGFTTTAVKTALANLGGINGVAVSGGNFAFWLQQVSNSVIRTGNVHTKGVVTAGLLVPVSLTAGYGQPVTINYLLHMVSSDGSSLPVAWTTSAALDLSQAGASEAYTLGTVSLNGAELGEVSSVTINFGLNVQLSGKKVLPVTAAIMSRSPSVTIATKDMDVPVGWGIAGAKQGESDSVITLDDLAAGGVRGSSPITISLDEGSMEHQDITGSHGQKVGTAILYTPVYDGVNDVMAISGI